MTVVVHAIPVWCRFVFIRRRSSPPLKRSGRCGGDNRRARHAARRAANWRCRAARHITGTLRRPRGGRFGRATRSIPCELVGRPRDWHDEVGGLPATARRCPWCAAPRGPWRCPWRAPVDDAPTIWPRSPSWRRLPSMVDGCWIDGRDSGQDPTRAFRGRRRAQDRWRLDDSTLVRRSGAMLIAASR